MVEYLYDSMHLIPFLWGALLWVISFTLQGNFMYTWTIMTFATCKHRTKSSLCFKTWWLGGSNGRIVDEVLECLFKVGELTRKYWTTPIFACMGYFFFFILHLCMDEMNLFVSHHPPPLLLCFHCPYLHNYIIYNRSLLNSKQVGCKFKPVWMFVLNKIIL